MPIIEKSNKLSKTQEEYRICSKPFVFFRLIGHTDNFRLMTATASEDSGEYQVFHDQQGLLKSTLSVFSDFDMASVMKEDHAGRLYAETNVLDNSQDLIHIATTVLNRLGFEDIQVIALQEVEALHDEFAADDDSEEAYLSDGVSATKDGRLVQR